MILKNLKYFVALSKNAHFRRAALECNISQPALSSAIKQLEDEFQVPLVRRGQKFQGLTPEGKKVLEWSERIITDTEAMHQEVSKLRKILEGRLRLGVIPTALSVLSHLTTPFYKYYPSVNISVKSMSSEEIQRALDNFEIDMGITYLDNEPLKRVKNTHLYNESYCLLISDDSPFKGYKTIKWEEAASLPLGLLGKNMQNRRIIDSVFSKVGVIAEPAFETDSIASLVPHVASEQLSAIVPSHIEIGSILPEGLSLIQLIKPNIKFKVGAIISDREPLPPTAKAMLEMIKELEISKLFSMSVDR
tara:strand:- start:1822 stop:2736 length:915 start_codon:yes stop_codon:yes gene_type:complete